MPFRPFAALLLFLALTGCVLQSAVPVFSASDGEPLLKDYGLHFASYSLDKGVWVKEADTIDFTARARHYEATTGDSAMDVTFANIGGSWWAMQAVEKDKGAVYALIEVKGGELFVHPVACKPLLQSAKFGDFIAFKNDDCFVKDGIDAMAMFRALAADPGISDMKLVPVK